MSHLDLKPGDRVRHSTNDVTGTVDMVATNGYSLYVNWDTPGLMDGPWNVSLERIEEPKPSPREDLLQEAIKAITKQRNNTYGPPTQDFQRTATINSSVGFRIVEADGTVRELKAHDVAIFMLGLKLSRLSWSPDHKDNWLDIAGYAGCGWECVVDEEREESA